MPCSSSGNIVVSTVLKCSVLGLILAGTAACQSTRVAQSGYLSSYAGLPQSAGKGDAHLRRDDTASDAIQSVYISPAVLAADIETQLSDQEKAMVVREVDRQICFEVSRRFTVDAMPTPRSAIIRTAIVRLESNSRVGSAAAAAVDFVNPIPLVNFRLPWTTGGLSAETELLAADGRQVAALVWGRNARVAGRIKPSLSRAGDALQLAEPLGDAVAQAFATKARGARIEKAAVDPCARFGPRQDIGRTVASGIVGFGTGLYMPQVSGTSLPAKQVVD